MAYDPTSTGLEGVEISAGVAHGVQSVIEEQVSNGVAVRMALLYLLAGAAREDGVPQAAAARSATSL